MSRTRAAPRTTTKRDCSLQLGDTSLITTSTVKNVFARCLGVRVIRAYMYFRRAAAAVVVSTRTLPEVHTFVFCINESRVTFPDRPCPTAEGEYVGFSRHCRLLLAFCASETRKQSDIRCVEVHVRSQSRYSRCASHGNRFQLWK